ncbi:hypothetical protein LguiA_020803 [Lonicera macranthoides]
MVKEKRKYRRSLSDNRVTITAESTAANDPLQTRRFKNRWTRQSRSDHTVLIHQPELGSCLLRNQGYRGQITYNRCRRCKYKFSAEQVLMD